MTRDEAAQALADAKGWTFEIGGPWQPLDKRQIGIGPADKYGSFKESIPIPAPDAPLHEKMEFVGRIAEAIKTNVFAVDMRHHEFTDVGPIAVTFKHEDGWCYSNDLCHAALLAALAALESR